VNFSLFAQDYSILNESDFSLYINGAKKDFGIVELESNDVLITVYEDVFNITIFNKTEYLFGETEYKVLIN